MRRQRLESLLCAALEKALAAPATSPKPPAGGELIWSWFLDLNRARKRDMNGPMPISYAEIDAYFRLSGWQAIIQPDHVRALMAMDRTFLKAASSSGGTKPVAVSANLNPNIFDAVF